MSQIFSDKKNSRTLIFSAIPVSLSFLLSRILGLLRDRLFASRFGAGPELDAYFAAYRIPDLIYSLLVLGTLTAAFLPVFATYLAKGEEGKKEAFDVARSLFTITVLILMISAGVLFVLAPQLVKFMAPGFDDERAKLMVTMSRIMLLQPILLGASSIIGSILTSFNRFIAYAAAPVLYNLGIIFGVLFFVPRMGVQGIAWGVVLGAILHFLIQVPSSLKVGFNFRPKLTFENEGLIQIGRMVVPRLISLAASQVESLIVTFIGSMYIAGSIAVYTFAGNLQAVPIGLIGISFAMAVFPQLSISAANNSREVFVNSLVRTMRLILYYILPFSVAMLLLRAQIVRVVLGSGKFSWTDTQLTLTVLGILVLAVFSESLKQLLARAFFSLQDTKTPMISSIIGILVNVVGAYYLGRQYGVAGLAMSFTISSILQLLILLTIIHQRLEGLHDKEFIQSVLKMCLATLLAGAAIQILKYPVAALVNMQTFLGVFIQLVVTSVGGVLVYIGMSKLLKLEEFEFMFQTIKNFLKRKSVPSAKEVVLSEDD